jgi:hypothetical protein
VHVHTTASWPAREDRRAALVWLAIFWIFVGVGFGFDLHNYFHELPPVPFIVHVHAVATTGWLLTATALVLMVETGNVGFHRRVGWFAAGYAALVIVIAPWSELSWQALNLQTPGSLPPQFLSIAFSGVICMASSAWPCFCPGAFSCAATLPPIGACLSWPRSVSATRALLGW